MKIIQLCGQLSLGGVTQFISDFNYGLKKNGYDVTVYYFQNENKMKDKSYYENIIPGVKYYDYSEEALKDINSADIVCVNVLMSNKTNNKYSDRFNKLLSEEINGPKKVLFMHNHMTIGYRNYYPADILTNKEFLSIFDKLVTFDTNTVVYNKIKETLGKEEALSKFVHLQLPYAFDKNCKDKWLSIKDKSKRISYIGRWSGIKHPQVMIDLCKLDYNPFECEMRGITRSIGTAATPDLYYEINAQSGKSFKESIVGPSKYTEIITNKWYEERGIDKSDLLLDYPRNNKMFIFGPYERSNGLKAMAKAAFCIDLFRLRKAHVYGDTLEYVMYETIEQGTIPLLDYFTGESVKMYENGVSTGKSMIDLNAGIFLKEDLSNIKEVIEQMEYLYNNAEEYEKFRLNCLEVLKKHSEPKPVTKQMISEIMK